MDSLRVEKQWWYPKMKVRKITPPKINIEPANDDLADVFPFPGFILKFHVNPPTCIFLLQRGNLTQVPRVNFGVLSSKCVSKTCGHAPECNYNTWATKRNTFDYTGCLIRILVWWYFFNPHRTGKYVIPGIYPKTTQGPLFSLQHLEFTLEPSTSCSSSCALSRIAREIYSPGP